MARESLASSFLWPRREEPLPPHFHFHFSLLFAVSLGTARVDGRALTWEELDALHRTGR